MSGNKMLKGAAVLAAAGIIVKLLGAVFRIPLANLVGTQGMSYYGSVYPIYTFFLIISTTGVPVAVSKMVSERIAVKNYEGANNVFRLALLLMTILGFGSFAICYFNAGFIETVILHNVGTKWALQAIAPSLFLVPMMAAYRGYFQGRQNMNPTAISQIFEQLIRVGAGLALVYILLPRGNEISIAGATFGCTAGAAVGLIVVVGIYLLNLKTFKKQDIIYRDFAQHESRGSIMARILAISIPITIGSSIYPLMSLIDSAIVLRRLQASGFSVEESDSLWGSLSGFCNPLISMPQVLLGAIVVSLVPVISAAYKLQHRGEVRENCSTAIRATMVIAIPCAAGIFALAKPILTLLFPRQLEEAVAAVPTLRWLCITIVIVGMLQVFTGILQSVDRQVLPVRNLVVGAVVKTILTYILVGIPLFNINGAAIGSIFGDGTAALLCQRDIRKYIKYRPEYIQAYLKPFIASALMGVVAFAAYQLLFYATGSNALSTLIAIIAGVISYGILILTLKIISKDEIRMLPKGEKIAGILDKFVRW